MEEEDAFSDRENSDTGNDADIDDNQMNADVENQIPYYLSPSSVRREAKKDDDCKFCSQHLQENDFKKTLDRE